MAVPPKRIGHSLCNTSSWCRALGALLRGLIVALVLIPLLTTPGQAGWWARVLGRFKTSAATARTEATSEKYVAEATHSGQSTPTMIERCQRSASLWARKSRDMPYGLDLPPQLQRLRPDLPLVVYIHGLNSRPEDLQTWVGDAQQAGLTCGTFRYPNDQALLSSAKLLSRDLKRLAKAQPARPVYLVTHSMGALVARAAVETPHLDPRNVQRLVMVAPPNHGSELARYKLPLDMFEYAVSSDRRAEAGLIRGAMADGWSEAVDDMRPDSQFLKDLNRRDRNARIQYSIFAGTAGLFTPDCVERFGETLSRPSWCRRWLRCEWLNCDVVGWAESSYDRRVLEVDEIYRGRGDGLVALRRARLAGVDDVVVGDFSHSALLRPDSRDAVHHRMRRLIVQRLGKDSPAPL